MTFTELFQALKSRPSQQHKTVWLPDASAAPAADQSGYFQIRLSEMFLSDDRRWFREIMPTTFLLADYHYNGAAISQPFFVSDQLLKGLEQTQAGRCRIRFFDKAIFGPVPYIGGEVSLFVGLFQATISDHRKALFSVFETLFSGAGLGGLSPYLKIAEQLTTQISDSLGSSDVECLLAEQRPIGRSAFPPSGYLVYLRSPGGEANAEGLLMQEGHLHRTINGRLQLVDDHDFCVIRIERLERRNDYMTMPFHPVWEEARKKIIANKVEEAQGLMLECAARILDSPDLTEEHKTSLIEFYQARLSASRTLLSGAATAGSMRAGGPDEVRRMQARAMNSRRVDAEELAGHFERIARLASQFESEPDDERDIATQMGRYLDTPRKQGTLTPPAELARALTIGALAPASPVR